MFNMWYSIDLTYEFSTMYVTINIREGNAGEDTDA